MNYLIDASMEENNKQLEKMAKLYFDELKSDISKTNNYLTVFINFSQQSNGYCNFIRDNNLINKYIKIYLLKKTGIEYLFGPLYVDNEKLHKLVIAIGNMKFDYYTDYKEVIYNYIKENNIDNHLIYY
jgi:hypothetical protein